MKKITILSILFLSLLNFSFANAATTESCKLSEGTPEVLTDFITNQRVLVNNITQELYKHTPKSSIWWDWAKVKSNVIRAFNETFNWYDSYFSYADFYITYPLSSEYVAEIRRDYDLLNNESQWLEDYYNYIANNWFTDINLDKKDICSGVENCDYNWNVVDVIVWIEWNLENLKNYYRLRIMWGSSLAPNSNITEPKLKLVNSDFIKTFNTYYSPNTWVECKDSEGSFFQKAWTAMKNIADYNNLAKDWFQSWKDAYDLAMWTTPNYSTVEKELLADELSRQWIWWSQADTILQNLENYNKAWWFSAKNNFITNSFAYVISSISKQADDFDENVIKNFWSDNKNNVVSVYDFWWTYQDTLIQDDLNSRLNIMKKSLEVVSSDNDKSIENIIIKLNSMHATLTAATKRLENLIPISQEVCDSQAKWVWNCK